MTTSTDEQDGRRGGLPEDDALDAFADAANKATGPRRRRRTPFPSPADPPAPDSPPEPPVEPEQHAPADSDERQPDPQPQTVLEPEPPHDTQNLPAPSIEKTPEPVPQDTARQPATVQIRNLGEPGQRATQCTIMVSTSVRDRFAHYQLTKKMEGREPTNAIVVRRAVLHARKNDLFAQLLEKVRHRQQPVEDEDHDPDGLFGEVPGRRAERGRVKDSVQQSFRPSYQELEVIDTITAAYRFPSRSDFLDAALDAFLPPLPSGKGRNR